MLSVTGVCQNPTQSFFDVICKPQLRTDYIGTAVYGAVQVCLILKYTVSVTMSNLLTVAMHKVSHVC